jgi:hypothetical protein
MTIAHVGTVVFPEMKSMLSVCEEEGRRFMHGKSSRGSGWVADQGRDAPFIHLAPIQTRSQMDRRIPQSSEIRCTQIQGIWARMNMFGNFGDIGTYDRLFAFGVTLDVNTATVRSTLVPWL